MKNSWLLSPRHFLAASKKIEQHGFVPPPRSLASASCFSLCGIAQFYPVTSVKRQQAISHPITRFRFVFFRFAGLRSFTLQKARSANKRSGQL